MDLGKRLFGWLTHSAASTTLTFVLGVTALVWFLDVVWTTDSNGALTGTFAFGTWVGLCALTAGLWAVVFIAGCHEVASLLPKEAAERKQRLMRGTAAVLALGLGAGIVMLRVGAEVGFEPDVPYWMVWQTILLITGGAAIGPWLVVTWWAHDSLADIKTNLAPRIDPLRRSQLEADIRLESFITLRATWPRLERCTAAMAVVLTSGVLCIGALRVALLQEGASAGKVPGEQQVLMYGVFFAVFVAVVVVPLMLAFRQRARDYMEAYYPATDPPPNTDDASKVSDLLFLARGPLRDPWALLGILTPVATGALAAYLPGLTR